MKLIKRIAFSVRAAAEVFKATKTEGCDSPLVVMTQQDLQQQMEDLSRLVVEKNLLYQTVDHVVDGGSPCDYCNDRDQCDHGNKGHVAPMCGIWDLLEIVKEIREEVLPDEQAAETEAAEANP